MKTKLLLGFAFLAFQFSFAKTLTVVDPVAPSISPFSTCDGNNDGLEVFDLITLSPQIIAAQSGAASNYVVAYYENFTDAQIGVNPIQGPYYNINPNSQTVYYRVSNITTSNYAVGSFQLIVNPTPDATIPSEYHLCDVNGAVGYETFNLNTVSQEVLGSINPSTVSVSFYTNQVDAEVGVNAIANASNYTNAVLWIETMYVRVEVISTGCYDVVPLQLVLDPLPQSTQPNYPQYAVCDYTSPIGFEAFDLNSKVSSILLGQTGMDVTFYPSLADAQSNTNVITNTSAYVNQVLYVQTLGIRITNQVTGCFVISTMDVRVSPLPNLIPPGSPYTVCDANQDGAADFDLTTLIPGLLSGQSYSITFHETLNDAETNGTTIPNPSSYMNINPFTQTIYARGEDNITGCATIVPIELVVNPAPVVGSLPSITVCDADANTQDGSTAVNLTLQTPAILALQPLPGSNYSVTFFTSQMLAEAGTAPIITETNYVGSDDQTFWYRVENNLSQCYNVGSFQLVVNIPLLLTIPTPLKVCDSDANPNNQITTFNLTVKNNEITQGLTGYSVTYYPSLADAQANTNVISNPTSYVNLVPAVQTLGVKVTSSLGCVSFTTLDIRAYPIPTPNTNPPALAPQCDVNNTGDMMEVFDLTVNAAYIMNGDPNLVLHFYHTMPDAIASVNEILTPAAALVGENVWIKVENIWTDYQGNNCYVLVEQPLTVNPLPNPELISNNTLNTVYVDALNNVVQGLMLDSQLHGNHTFAWEVDGAPIPAAVSSIYTVNTASPTGASRTFVVTATDMTTGCTASSSIVVVQSSGTPSPIGDISQTFNPGDTLAYLSVSGSNILWYSAASGKNTTTTYSTPLPLSTPLVNNTTYYASQTIGGLESIARLPVTVSWALGTPENEIASLQFAPNPVKNSLTLQSQVILKSVSVYTMLGQKVFEQNYNDMNVTIDLSRLDTGNYFLKVQGDTGQKTIRIIKE